MTTRNDLAVDRGAERGQAIPGALGCVCQTRHSRQFSRGSYD